MADIVDDLNAAEDFAGVCVAALEEVLELGDHLAAPRSEVERLRVVLARVRYLAREWDDYCRPGCGAHGNHAKCEGEDPDCCGCRCGHAQAGA